MLIARQSTARTVTVGPVLDADGAAVTDGVVGDFKIAKNGGAPAALNGSATATHRHTGFYSLALTASDLDTVGTAEVTIDDTTNSMAMKEISVVEEAVYDALFAAGAAGYQVPIWSSASANVSLTNTTVATVTAVTNTVNANAVQVSGDSTAADNLEALLDGTGGVTLVASAITLTTPVTANVTQISGDSTAADNLESYTDGTTPMPVNATQVSGSATAADNVEQVFSTDFADAYDATNNVWNANVTLSNGEAVENYEGALASATASTVTFPATDALGNAVPESPDYAAWKEIQVGTTRLVLGEWVSGRTFNVHKGDATGLGGSNYVRLFDVRANVTALGDSTTPVANMTTVYSTDFAANYNTTDDAWAVKIKGNISHGGVGTVVTFPTFTTDITGNLTGSVGSVAGNVGGSVNSVATAVAVGSVGTGVITRASLAADTGLQTVRSNTAQSATSTTITLDASASATNDFYNNCRIFITGGTGAGQSRRILDYVGSTKVATVRAWSTSPDNTSTFAIVPEESVWDDVTADHLASGSAGNTLNAAGSAGDPWSTALPGSYGTGTAGNLVGNNLNATVSSRLASASYTAPLDAAGTRSAVGLAAANLDTQLATIDSVADAILADTGTDGVVVSGPSVRTAVGLGSANLDSILGDLPTNSELATALTTALTTALNEGYRTTGATGSVRDLLYEIIGHLGESSISGSTKTVKRLDGSTTAKTYTLNSATSPTSISETT